MFFFNNIKKYTYYNYLSYQKYNLYYLQYIYKINLIEKNINAMQALPNSISKQILFKTQRRRVQQYNIKYFNEVVYMIVINVWLKNSKNICKFIRQKLDNVHFKFHKKYFLFFFKIFNQFVLPNFRLLHLKGLTLKFRGKLGRGGNARKAVIFYKKGYYSLSNKTLCLHKNSWDTWTKTGSIGCVFQLFFFYMTTYLTIYLIIYIITLLCLQYIIKTTFTDKVVIHSFSQTVLHVLKYSKLKPLFYGLFLLLTGIPPFFLFYIKFNYLIEVTWHLNIILIGFIFLFFFLNMLYYIQLFVVRNTNILLNTKIVKKQRIKYNIIFFITFVVFMQIFGIFFLTDIYMFLNLIV